MSIPTEITSFKIGRHQGLQDALAVASNALAEINRLHGHQSYTLEPVIVAIQTLIDEVHKCGMEL